MKTNLNILEVREERAAWRRGFPRVSDHVQLRPEHKRVQHATTQSSIERPHYALSLHSILLSVCLSTS